MSLRNDVLRNCPQAAKMSLPEPQADISTAQLQLRKQSRQTRTAWPPNRDGDTSLLDGGSKRGDSLIGGALERSARPGIEGNQIHHRWDLTRLQKQLRQLLCFCDRVVHAYGTVRNKERGAFPDCTRADKWSTESQSSNSAYHEA